MPEWNLADLYAGMDSPAIKSDLDQAAADATRIKSASRASSFFLAATGAALAEAIRAYEQLSDLIGKLRLPRRPALCRRHHQRCPHHVYSNIQEKDHRDHRLI